MKYANLSFRKIKAIINRLGKFLRGESSVSEPFCSWREKDSVIYFKLPSTDGTTGTQWIERLKKKGLKVSVWAEQVLNSPAFLPTRGIIYEVAVFKWMLWNDSERNSKDIHTKASSLGWTKPNAEVACLILEKFTDKEIAAMGLWWIVTMNDPINNFHDDPLLLEIARTSEASDNLWLDTLYARPNDKWANNVGFAFVKDCPINMTKLLTRRTFPFQYYSFFCFIIGFPFLYFLYKWSGNARLVNNRETSLSAGSSFFFLLTGILLLVYDWGEPAKLVILAAIVVFGCSAILSGIAIQGFMDAIAKVNCQFNSSNINLTED